MSRTSFLIRIAVAVFVSSLALPARAQTPTLTVFAAASLKNALDDVNSAFAQRSGVKVTVSFAATSTLIKQIEQGAPADVFLSADLAWMDYGVEKKAIAAETRFNLLGNRLVLVAPKDSPLEHRTIGPGFDLARLAGKERIAVADVRAVPAGKYAKAALEMLGAWQAAEPKLAMADNVRAALLLVARGETALGIVYETDAAVEPGVKILGAFPAGSHPPIIYPAASTVSAKPQAAAYLAFLRSLDAKPIFEKYGFTFLPSP